MKREGEWLMNSKDRVIRAPKRQKPDRVPMLELSINQKVINSLYPGKNYYEFVEEIGLNVVGLNKGFDTLGLIQREIPVREGVEFHKMD